MGNHFCLQKRSRYSWKLWSFPACICNSDQLKQRMLFYVVVVLWLAMLRYLNVLNFKSFCLNSNLNFPRFFCSFMFCTGFFHFILLLLLVCFFIAVRGFHPKKVGDGYFRDWPVFQVCINERWVISGFP